MLQMLGAVAEYERSLIRERTRAGLAAARARGRVGGNPKLKQGDKVTAQCLADRQRQLYLLELTRTAEEWLPTVRRLRPSRSWAAVTRAVNAKLPPGRHWTAERLRRAVRAFVDEGLANRVLLDKAPSVRADDRLMVLVAGIARANPKLSLRANPKLSLRAIGAQLEAMWETTPRGGQSWAAASVKNLLDRARAQGLLSAIPSVGTND